MSSEPISRPQIRHVYQVGVGIVIGAVGWSLLAISGPDTVWLAFSWLGLGFVALVVLFRPARRNFPWLIAWGAVSLVLPVVAVLWQSAPISMAVPFVPMFLAFVGLASAVSGRRQRARDFG